MTDHKTIYRNGAMLPDPDRVAAACYVRRDPYTFEISWPPTQTAAVLKTLGLILNETDLDHDT